MLHFSETEVNENDPILFIHGIGASRWMWWQQEKAFSDYPIILVDLPGHGKSVSVLWTSLRDATDLIAREILGNRAVHVVGIYLHKIAREYYHLPPNKVSDFITNYRLLTSETYETIWKEIMQFRLDQSYGKITAPCLFAAGDQESHGILEAVKIAPEFIPNSVGRLIPGAQHAWPVQKAHEFNQLLRAWLNCLHDEKHGE